jgi:hypothetical protein
MTRHVPASIVFARTHISVFQLSELKGFAAISKAAAVGHALVAPPGFECLTLKRRT